MAARTASLELTLLGLLSAGPLHGYELRKRSLAILGPFRALSFGSLYPQLRRMALSNLIEVSENQSVLGASRRTKISYSITAAGKKRFAELTENSDASEDEAFGVHFAFFGPTSRTSRVRILEARRRRLKDKAELLSKELERSPLNSDVLGIDKYLSEWRRHSLDSATREVAWLDEMIQSERKTQ